MDVIKRTYDADYDRYPGQLTTVLPNTTEREYQEAEWWDFDPIEFHGSQNNSKNQNGYPNQIESTALFNYFSLQEPFNTIYLTPQNADSVLQTLTLPSMQDLKRRRKPFSFTVEGIVGSGKSTLLSAFKVSSAYPF